MDVLVICMYQFWFLRSVLFLFSAEIKQQFDIVIAFIDENKVRSQNKIDSNFVNILEEKNELDEIYSNGYHFHYSIGI